MVVGGEKAVTHVAQSAAERVTNGTGFGAVPCRSNHPDGLALAVEHDRGAGLGPAVAAVAASHPVFGFEHTAAVKGLLDSSERPGQVVGVDNLHPALDPGHEVGRIGAVNGHRHLVPGQLAGADVPVPCAHLDGLQRSSRPAAAGLLLGGAGRWRGLDHSFVRPGGHCRQKAPLLLRGFSCGAGHDGECAYRTLRARQRLGSQTRTGPCARRSHAGGAGIVVDLGHPYA